MSVQGSPISRALALHFTLHNRAAFLEHFIKKARKRKKVKCRYFHLPAIHSDDAVVLGGRSHGKSFAILEPRMVQSMLNEPEEESVLTSFRRLHIVDRSESAISILNQIPYFKAFIRYVRRTPHYEINLKNGHSYYGISVGDDPLAISIQGKHPRCLPGNQIIITTVGLVPISKLFSLCKKEDVYVPAYDIENRCFVEKKILHVFQNPRNNRRIIKLTVGDRRDCSLTEDHEVFCPDTNYNIIKRKAVDLRIGDPVMINHVFGMDSISKIEVIDNPTDILYDIEVEDVHNYYAGGILVSNCRYGEEFSAFTNVAWKQWQSTVHPEGCKDLYCGVVDGRVDTPFRHLDTPGDPAIDKFFGKRFHIPRYFDPYWDEALKQDCIRNLGGENSDEYMQQVKAKWGSPSSAVWDIMAIYDCMHKELVCPRFEYDATTIDEFSEIYLPEKPAGTIRIALGIDSGYAEPTEIAAFAQINGRWRMFARVGLRGKIIYETQAIVIDKIATYYNAEFIGIDSTNSPVLASLLSNPAGQYKDKEYADRVVEVAYNENIEFELNGDKKKLKCKNFATEFLRSMFKRRLFELPLDEELINQFNTEKQKKTPTTLVILTPDNVHITDSIRCFCVAYFKKYTEDFIEQDRVSSALPLPMTGDSGVFRAPALPSQESIVNSVLSSIPGFRLLR